MSRKKRKKQPLDLRRQVLLRSTLKTSESNAQAADIKNKKKSQPVEKQPQEELTLGMYLIHHLVLLILYGGKFEDIHSLEINANDIQTPKTTQEGSNPETNSCPDQYFLQFTLSVILNSEDTREFRLLFEKRKSSEHLANLFDYFDSNDLNYKKTYRRVVKVLNKDTLSLQHLFSSPYDKFGSPLILTTSSWNELVQADALTHFFKAIVNSNNENELSNVRLTALKLTGSYRTVYFLKSEKTRYRLVWENAAEQQYQLLNWREFFPAGCKRREAQEHLNTILYEMSNPPENTNPTPSVR